VPKRTTVYVGKIAPTVDDTFMRQLLEACGEMRSWKRVEDPETKQAKGFGFCEFEEADGCHRALRLLGSLQVGPGTGTRFQEAPHMHRPCGCA
jgi:RNA-binding protein 25